MPWNVLPDLAVLGIAASGPAPLNQVVKTAKSLLPDLWNPTSDVIEQAILRLLSDGLVIASDQDGAPECLHVTADGQHRLRRLLCFDPGYMTSPATLAVEAVQFRFLDVADNDATDQVLRRLRGRIERRRDELEHRYKDQPSQDRFANLWMTMEQVRLTEMARLMALIGREAVPNGRPALPASGAAI